MKLINSFFILILLLFFIPGAIAESGTLHISDGTTNSYQIIFGGQTGSIDWSQAFFDIADYNYISKVEVTCAGCTFNQNSGTEYGTITAGGSGSYQVTWDKNTTKIIFYFNNAQITASPFTMTRSSGDNLANSVPYTTPTIATASSYISATSPILFKNTFQSTAAVSGLPMISSTQLTTTNNYDVSYSSFANLTFFNVTITKPAGSVADKIIVMPYGTGANYYNESAYNTNSFYTGALEYLQGIKLKMVISSGSYDIVTVNTTGVTQAAAAGINITTDKASYQRADPITITVSNPSASKVYVTGYGPTGIMTDILWNNEVAAGATITWNKIIKDDYPLGNYSISAATTSSYAPVVAITYFSITLPANTTNKLGLLWSDSIYHTGTTGTINSQSNYNTTTMIITSPGGHNQTFNFAANATNSTGISLDESGTWQAKLTDNGNTSNYLISYTSAQPTRSNDGCAYVQGQKTYVCWDKIEYRQGENFTIYYKLTPKITDIASFYPYIVIDSPDDKTLLNRSINGTFQSDATYRGTISGSFSMTATLGDYYARIYVKPLTIFDPELRGEAFATLLKANTTPIPTPTPGAPGISNNAANLLNVFTYMAFYGLVIFLGIFFSAIKLMTAHGAQANGHALVIIMAVVATMEALIGLFDPFKFYIIVITWIFAAIYFKQNRTAATGEQ